MHPDAWFSVVVPVDWHAQPTPTGWNLLRDTPYGNGHPSISLRRLPPDLGDYSIGGKLVVEDLRRLEYRFHTWRNARGGGHTLEVLLSSAQHGMVLVEASVWDPLPHPDERFFDEVIWPIVRSVRLDEQAAPAPGKPTTAPPAPSP